MAHPGTDAEPWGPATAEGLAADALARGIPQASGRMVKDWTEQGLLAAPAFRKATRHGSDARLYPPEQRRLFHTLLDIRERSPRPRLPHHALAPVVLYLWLTDDVTIANAQARRAWRTWARAAGRNSAAGHAATARSVVDQVAHASASYHERRKAQLVLEQAARSGAAPDWARLCSVLTAVCSPWPAFPGQRVERGLGTGDSPFGVEEVVAMWMINRATIKRLAAERVGEEELGQARSAHRVEWTAYEAARPALERRSADPLLFAVSQVAERHIRERVSAFVPLLGYRLGLGAAAHTRAAALAR